MREERRKKWRESEDKVENAENGGIKWREERYRKSQKIRRERRQCR